MKEQDPKSAFSILLIEDNLGDARLLEEFLSDPAAATFQVEHCSLLAQGLSRLAQGGVDLVLLDLFLPDSMGLDTFSQVRACAREVPIIVMSGLDDESLAIKTVHEGAQDYLVKGHVDSRLLTRAIRYAIERSRAEEALAKERDLLHTLLNNLPDRIYLKDRDCCFLRISRAVADQFKLHDPKEARGKTDSDFFTAEHAQATLQDERRIMETGQPILNKVEKETLPDGSITYALTSKMPLRDKQGQIIGTFGISRDITKLKHFENQLASERNLLRSLIDNLPDYIYIKDLQGRYLVDNIAHRRFLGAGTETQVLGKTAADFFPRDMAARILRDDQSITQTGQPIVNQEEEMADATGQHRWHTVTKVPLRNAENKIIGLVGIGRDITEKKLAERELQQANTELAQSQAELVRVLADLRHSHQELKAAQFQLIQAEKMQSIGRLAAGIAHEVKNPLAILGMGIDYLSKSLSSPDENVGLILADMQDAMRRADSIILGLLDFSAPHALNLLRADLSQLMEQSLTLVRHELGQQITLSKSFSPELPTVPLDQNKIKQALVNILSNAIHAMPNGGTLTVRTFAKQLQPGEIDRDAGSRDADRFRAGDTVVMAEISDTGQGIPDETLGKIFDPFFTTKPTGQGTGLGLTVTKKIIELHGGSIHITNRKDDGVTVTLMFKA